jgi:hypothetical protein
MQDNAAIVYINLMKRLTVVLSIYYFPSTV